MVKGNILIIDDEELVCKSLSIILEEAGYETTSVLTGEEGLKVAKEGNYDVVLIDLKIPDINGLEVFKKLREMDPAVVAIIITGYPSEETIVEALKDGVFDYIAKPFVVSHITSLVERAVTRRKELLEKAKENMDKGSES